MGAPVRRNVRYYFDGRGIPIAAHGPTAPARAQLSGTFLIKTQGPAAVEIPKLHAALQARRLDAAADASKRTAGPRVLVVGEVDTGKSTLCRNLINLAVTSGTDVGVTYVDVDVGQTAISIPGVIGATFHEGPIAVDDDFTNVTPLAFFFGDKTVTPELKGRYLDLCSYVNECAEALQPTNDGYRIGGMIVNTMGWVSGLGYALIQQMIDIFKITDVIVTGSNVELQQTIQQDSLASGRRVEVHDYRLPQGLFDRSKSVRTIARSRQLLSYFIGTRRTPFAPCRVVAEIKDLVLLDATTFAELTPGDVKPLSVAAISFAPHIESVRSANVAGFVVILDVGKTTMTLLAPSPEALPRNVLLVTNRISLLPADVPPLL